MITDALMDRIFPPDTTGRIWKDATGDDLARAQKAYGQCSAIAVAIFNADVSTITTRPVMVRDFGGGVAEGHAPKIGMLDFAKGCYEQLDVFCVESFGPWTGAVNLVDRAIWRTDSNTDS